MSRCQAPLLPLLFLALLAGPPATGRPTAADDKPAPAGVGRAGPAGPGDDPLPPGALARLGTTRLRHADWITALAYSPDGTVLAAASGSPGSDSEGFRHLGWTRSRPADTLRLWDVRTGRQLRRLDGLKHLPLSLAFSDGGKLLWARAQEGVQAWDPATGREVADTDRVEFTAGGAAPSPDGAVLARCLPEAVALLNLADGKEVRRWELSKGRPWALVFSPDGTTLAAIFSTGRNEGGVCVWDVSSGRELCRLPFEAANVPLAVAPGGKAVATCKPQGDNAPVRLWDTGTGKEVRTLGASGGPVRFFAFSRGGQELLAVRDEVAFRAVRRLAQAPAQALPHIRERLGREPAADAARLARLIGDLDADDFDRREAASAELARLGKAAESALKGVLEGKPSPEARKRAEALLKRLGEPRVSPAELQALRAVEVLERIATPEARRVIESVAKGAGGARVAGQAKAALDRLADRPAP